MNDVPFERLSLVKENKALDCREVEPSAFSSLTSERVRILSFLAKEPRYPADLAREMKMPGQTMYYHVRELKKAGLVEFADYEQQKGGLAKKYRALSSSLAVVLNPSWKQFATAPSKSVPRFFEPFVQNGFFSGYFVLGSPDPHGPYKAHGSEFYALEVSALLGNYASFSYPLYFLDTELSDRTRKENLIAVGGPKVNTLVYSINESLPISFDQTSFEVRSSISGKKYPENVGVIELVQNPFNKSKSILVVAGMKQAATRVAILALLKKREEIEKGNLHDSSKLAKVVQGFDADADGIVDSVEILE